ncbi:CXXC-20-CXXC protein [Evansella vedderi]|uniref:CXXC-20-CXXC protein n=1 Tax=Evansella vedderi TaxID=38282 RepID=A0ABT9ZVA2_9BACI|nr:TIGR04104 family putative zinc finger protein [Evansella vedderi]MDQ0255164.1 CXXC-20-CXXC protein [Evansella vedderi]
MKLPNCWSCNHTYKYSEALKFFWSKECPKCGKRQTLSSKSNLRTMIPTLLILFLPGYFIRYYLEIAFISYVYIGIGLFLIAMLLTPFFFEFTNKSESGLSNY